MYKNVQNVQKCTKMYKNVQKCTKMYKNANFSKILERKCGKIGFFQTFWHKVGKSSSNCDFPGGIFGRKNSQKISKFQNFAKISIPVGIKKLTFEWRNFKILGKNSIPWGIALTFWGSFWQKMKKKIEIGLKNPNFWQKFWNFSNFSNFFAQKFAKGFFLGYRRVETAFLQENLLIFRQIFWEEIANFPQNFWKIANFPQNAIPKGIKLKNIVLHSKVNLIPQGIGFFRKLEIFRKIP